MNSASEWAIVLPSGRRLFVAKSETPWTGEHYSLYSLREGAMKAKAVKSSAGVANAKSLTAARIQAFLWLTYDSQYRARRCELSYIIENRWCKYGDMMSWYDTQFDAQMNEGDKSDNVDAFANKTTEPQGARTAKEGETMSIAITKEPVAAALPEQRLKEIEYEIHFHVTHAAGHLLEVGRCLNAAKDEGLVSHGQWEEWVEKYAGVGVRTAQRMMAAAREVAADSPLARLEFSKVRALLALPAGEREEFAEEHNADSASVRELEAAIKAKQEAERRANELESAIAARDSHYAKTQAELAKKLNAVETQAASAKRDAQVYLEDKRALEREEENLHDQLRLRRADIDRLKTELNNAMTNGTSDGISAKAQAKIDAMQAELDAQEAEIERQAKLRAEAQAELLRARSQAARGETGECAGEQFTADDLGAAARLFIGRAAVLPHMAAQLASMPENERRAYRQYIDMLADWCESSRAALDTIEAGVIDG